MSVLTVRIASRIRTRQSAIKILCIFGVIPGLARPLPGIQLPFISHPPDQMKPTLVATVEKNSRARDHSIRNAE